MGSKRVQPSCTIKLLAKEANKRYQRAVVFAGNDFDDPDAEVLFEAKAFVGNPSLSWASSLLYELKDYFTDGCTVCFCIIDDWVPTTEVPQEMMLDAFKAIMENGPLLTVQNEGNEIVRASYNRHDPLDIIPLGIYKYYDLSALLGLIEGLNWDSLTSWGDNDD